MRSAKYVPLLTLAVFCAAALNACYRAKSPDQVAKDTAAAAKSATESTAKAEQTADARVRSPW